MLKTVIAVCGPRLSGKDTVADILSKLLGYKKTPLAEALKEEYAELHDIPISVVYDQGPEKEQHRMGLITLGAVRRIQDIEWWCSAVKNKNENESIILSDLRYKNEIGYFVEHSDNFILIRIGAKVDTLRERGWKASPSDKDKSETSQELFKEDFIVYNNGTMEDLEEQLVKVIDSIFKQTKEN